MSSWEELGTAASASAAGRSRVLPIPRRGGLTVLYGGAISMSAFLLFQVEPIMGRLVLPWFGGSAAVWTVTVLFFQAVLVLGYLYAHVLVRYVAPRRQMLVHVPLLLASLLVLPILPSASWKPLGGQDPTLRILGLLATTIGPPFLVLSTCGPLLQAWYARGAGRPYRLFAVSNAASLLGLVSYPLAVEPLLGLHLQADAWSAAYGLFVVLAVAITVRAGLSAPAREIARAAGPGDGPRPRVVDQARWLALAATPAVLFLAVTNHLTRNVAPIPLLWVLPLAIYLLSLVLCFEGESGYQRRLFLPLLPVALALMAYNLFPGELAVGIGFQIAFFGATLLVCCMVCHGELARLRPPASHLTSFYLMVACGGALGGLFVAVAAPQLFSDYFELALGVVLCAIVVLTALLPRLVSRGSATTVWRRMLAVAAIAGSLALCLYVVGKASRYDTADRFVARNFYGVLSVRETGAGSEAARLLFSGTIIHGAEFSRPARAMQPTAYYGPESGVGVAVRLEDEMRERIHVGVIGLGVGTIAAYGRSGDRYGFYEIDPLDISIAERRFDYLKDSPAAVGVVAGDARLSLEREASARFDVLAVDAFSGDSIPVHLLTLQAFQLYFRHLGPNGILAVHISNRFLDLAPVVARAARALGEHAVLIDSPAAPRDLVYRARWVLVTGSPSLAARLARAGRGAPLAADDRTRLWTDDYSDVLGALR